MFFMLYFFFDHQLLCCLLQERGLLDYIIFLFCCFMQLSNSLVQYGAWWCGKCVELGWSTRNFTCLWYMNAPVCYCLWKATLNMMTSLETSQDLNSFNTAKQLLAAMTCLIITNVQFWVNYPLVVFWRSLFFIYFHMNAHRKFSHPFFLENDYG